MGVVKEQSQFWLTYLTAVFRPADLYGVIRWCRGRMRFTRALLAEFWAFRYSIRWRILHWANFRSGRGDANYRSESVMWPPVANDLPDDQYFTESIPPTVTDNIGLWMEKPCIQFFNSVGHAVHHGFYPGKCEAQDGYPPSRDQKLYALRAWSLVERGVCGGADYSGTRWERIHPKGG